MARWVLLMVILMAILVVPIWLKRSKDNDEKARTSKEATIANGTPAELAAAATPSSAGPRPIGNGLTYALLSTLEGAPPDITFASCAGEPKPTGKSEKGACNPYQGDTSCSTVLPMLCLKPEGLAIPTGTDGNQVESWSGGTLGATAPVMGAVLESQHLADARCEKELGAGYRMADWHAGPGGYSVRGKSGQNVGIAGVSRYWVAIKDQPANCWDSAP